ncbi:MAG: hypothetical protein ACK42H_01770, partial [Planctomycetota bacterium]
YYLQTYSISPQDGGTFFEKRATTPNFPIGQWVSIKVDVDVKSAIVRTYQNGELVSEGPYKSRPGIAGAHMGLYPNRLINQATVYNRACQISVRSSAELRIVRFELVSKRRNSRLSQQRVIDQSFHQTIEQMAVGQFRDR